MFLPSTYLRARPPPHVWHAGLRASASDVPCHLRRGTSVCRLERRLPPLFPQPLESASTLRFDLWRPAQFGGFAAGAGDRRPGCHTLQEDRPPYSGCGHRTRSYVAGFPRQPLLRTAIRATVASDQPDRSAWRGPRLARAFRLRAPAAKPKKNAPPEIHEAYKKEKKLRALPLAGLAAIASVRQSLDERVDTAQRQLIISGDGSYTNKTVLRGLPPRTTFIGRIRKDAKLCLPLAERDGATGRPRLYGPSAPTPEHILQDDSIPVVKILCFAAGKLHEIPVKVYGPVYWRKAGVDVPLLLVVIKPLGYRLLIGSKLLYRQPAFLVCTDVHLDLQLLVQSYIQRWEIECNHRDEKSLLGVAQGQVRSPLAVSRLPQFQVAAYSLLLLASLLTSGFQRTADYLPLPKWRRQAARPSLLDLLNLLRQQIFARGVDAAVVNFDDFASAPTPPAVKSSKLPLAAETLATLAA